MEGIVKEASPAVRNYKLRHQVTVLAPVNKISGHLQDICAMEGIVKEVSPAVRNYKLQHQVTAYVAKKYLSALVAESGKTKDCKEDIELSGEQIGKIEGITKIRLNLPKEFQIGTKATTPPRH
jgi:hypothetical protein